MYNGRRNLGVGDVFVLGGGGGGGGGRGMGKKLLSKQASPDADRARSPHEGLQQLHTIGLLHGSYHARWRRHRLPHTTCQPSFVSAWSRLCSLSLSHQGRTHLDFLRGLGQGACTKTRTLKQITKVAEASHFEQIKRRQNSAASLQLAVSSGTTQRVYPMSGI